MAAHVLVLYVSVHRDDVNACQTTGLLPRRYAGGRNYIGLREKPEDALERASMLKTDDVSKSTHALLEWRLSAAALAHFVTTCSGPENHFASMLNKKTFSGTTDWKVWHFLGDLPLRFPGTDFEFHVIE